MAEFSANAAQRIGRATVKVERGMRNTSPRRARWFGLSDGARIVGFTLTEDMGDTTAGEASATIKATWDASSETYTGSDSGVVVDPLGIFAEATSGADGKGVLRQGNGRTVIDPLIMDCPT